jgi:hypothetical protein
MASGCVCVCAKARAALQELQRIWAQVLCIPHAQVLLNVPFIEYGGDSLLAIEVLSHAARARLQLGPAAALTPNFEMVCSIVCMSLCVCVSLSLCVSVYLSLSLFLSLSFSRSLSLSLSLC